MSFIRVATPLPVIEVETPCTVDWDAMSGDARARFCRIANVMCMICRRCAASKSQISSAATPGGCVLVSSRRRMGR